MFLETLSNSLPTYREYALVAMIIFIVAQLVIVTLLVMYTILNRLWENHQQTVQEKKNSYWYTYLFDYLDGEFSGEEFKNLVPVKDFPYFIEFIKDFFLDLAGDEKDKLRILLISLGLEQYMIRQLSHRSFWKRMYAVYFLGLMNCGQAIPHLKRRIYDKSDLVGMMAISNLMQLKDLESVPEIITHINKSSIHENRTQMTFFLMEFGPEILPQLEQMFRNEPLEDWILEVFLRLFGHYVHFSVTDAVLSLYETSSNVDLKAACIKTLGEFEDPELIDFYEDLLQSSPFPVKVQTIKALAKLGSDTSVRKFAELAQSENFWVAKSSVEALRGYGTAGADELKKILTTTQSTMTRDLIRENLGESSL